MPRASRCSSMPRPGSSAAIRMSSAARCSTPSRWASTRRRRSCATRASTASRCARSTSIISDWDCTLEADAPRDGQRRTPRASHARDGGRHPRDASRVAARLPPDQGRCARTTCARSSRGAATATIPSAISGCAPGLSPRVLERLADADAFRSLGLDRRDGAVGGARPRTAPATRTICRSCATCAFARAEPDAQLPPMPLGEHVVEDYRFLSLSLKAHPVSFLRDAARRARSVLPRRSSSRVPAERPPRDASRASCWCASGRARPRASSS